METRSSKFISVELRSSIERPKDRRDFFHHHAQAQAALAKFSVHGVIGIRRAVQQAADLDFVFGESVRMRMTRVLPMP